MENEFFDEPRKCPNCGIVTYCDGCPTCGRKLPRSSSGRWKRIYGRGVAGEAEGVLQTVDTGKLREHIDIRDSQSSNRVFKEATHFEPKVDFHSRHVEPQVNFNRESVKPSHPFFESNEVKIERNPSGTLAKIGSVLLVLFVVAILFFTQFYDVKWSDTDYGDMISERTPIENANGDIHLYDYSYDWFEDASTMQLDNTGDRTFFGTLIIYNDDTLVGSYEKILILPNEGFSLTLDSDDEANAYEFVNYEFFEVSTAKPAFDFQVYNDYGMVDIDVYEDSLSESDIEHFIRYIMEASSFSKADKVYCMNIYPTRGNMYEVYIDEYTNTATIYITDENDDIIDTYEVKIIDNIDTTL